LTPVREIDTRVVGKGSMGDITKRLQEAYFDVVTGKTRNILTLYIYY